MTNVLRAFTEKFNKHPLLVRAPGRINLIGEHTDYNGGFVMPASIDKAIRIAITASGTDVCELVALDLNEVQSFSVTTLTPSNDWSTYIKGVINAFTELGFQPKGVRAVFNSDVPLGAGLSSSAALCSGFAFAINELFGFGLDRLALARIAQRSEHTFAGVKCGIMDMYASLFGKKDSVVLLDCHSSTHEYFPLQLTDHSLLLIDTKVKHSLASSAYNKRRASCEEGVHIIQQEHPHVHSLRDVSAGLLESYKSQLSAETFLRCHFIVSEIERTSRAAQYLKQGLVHEFGACMYQTHEGLSKEYEVSCVESDFLVALAQQAGITGARQMGGGFGGCTINLIQDSKLEEFKKEAAVRYEKQFNVTPAFYEVRIENGVSIETL